MAKIARVIQPIPPPPLLFADDALEGGWLPVAAGGEGVVAGAGALLGGGAEVGGGAVVGGGAAVATVTVTVDLVVPFDPVQLIG